VESIYFPVFYRQKTGGHDEKIRKQGGFGGKNVNQKRSTQGKVVQSCAFFLQFFAEFCKPLRFLCNFLQIFAVFYTPRAFGR
jgi:hypothetical protein